MRNARAVRIAVHRRGRRTALRANPIVPHQTGEAHRGHHPHQRRAMLRQGVMRSRLGPANNLALHQRSDRANARRSGNSRNGNSNNNAACAHNHPMRVRRATHLGSDRRFSVVHDRMRNRVHLRETAHPCWIECASAPPGHRPIASTVAPPQCASVPRNPGAISTDPRLRCRIA